jgi:sialidase-1
MSTYTNPISTAVRFLRTFRVAVTSSSSSLFRSWRVACVAIALAPWTCAAAEPQFSDVFVAGRDPFPSIRIPSVVVTKTGVVLAFAEGRAVAADQAQNKIILKRSHDDGRTWGAMQIVTEDGANSLNNPTAVVEQPGGRVWLMYQRIPGHLTERSQEIATGYDGTNVYRNFLVWSDDNGAIWSQPRDVTRSTKRPTRATTIASGPGIGIQLTRGPHAGRLIFPFNEGPFYQWNNFAVFSDDCGVTWQCGENVPGALLTDAQGRTRSQLNEVQMVELADGSVRLNSRQFAGAKVRKTAVSHDGGVTWTPVKDVPELRDPSCMGSIFRTEDKDGNGVLLYSGPDSLKRENGTVHLSRDEGQSWPVKKVLWPGSFAYSVLTRLPDGTLGCLFETDGTDRIVFARFSLAWLTDGTGKFAPGRN